MPRFVQTAIHNFAPQTLTFAMPDFIRDAPIIYRREDGSLILDAVPLIANQDLLYYGWELPLDVLFGEGHGFDYDTPLTARITTDAAEDMLDQFEGLAITEGHVDVLPGYRQEVAVGTFLQTAVLDGDKVRARALIYAATAIVTVDANGSELSIGGDGFLEANPSRGMEGEPDFFIRRVNLNHVALVKEGRNGPEARLLNHKAALANKEKEVPTMKVTINGVELEVPDMVVNHYAAEITAREDKVTALTNQVGTLTAERDTAQNALALAETAKDEAIAIANAAPDVNAVAAQLATDHATFATEATKLGHSEPLELGKYDKQGVMRQILNGRGAKFDENSSVDAVLGVWKYALDNAAPSTTSVVDPIAPLANAAAAPATISAGATAAVRNSYFGGGKKEA